MMIPLVEKRKEVLIIRMIIKQFIFTVKAMIKERRNCCSV